MALKLNEFDPARYLDDDEAICDYLDAILEEDEPGYSLPLLATSPRHVT